MLRMLALATLPRELPLPREREGVSRVVLRWLDSAVSWHLQGAFALAWASGWAGVMRARSVRVRSFEVLARFPRWERASRRASTRSRLGLLMGLEGLRLTGGALSLKRAAR